MQRHTEYSVLRFFNRRHMPVRKLHTTDYGFAYVMADAGLCACVSVCKPCAITFAPKIPVIAVKGLLSRRKLS